MFLSSVSINLLAFYHKFCSLMGLILLTNYSVIDSEQLSSVPLRAISLHFQGTCGEDLQSMKF